jgi:hypothetical protein
MRQLILLAFVVLFVGIGFTLVAQDDDSDPILQISVAGETCDLALAETEADAEATPEIESTEEADIEATEEPEAEPEIESTEEADIEATEEPESSDTAEGTVITLASEGCEEVLSQLRVASNDTLWIALSAPGEEEWQEFSTVEGDDAPLKFDRRGRYIGCSIPEEGTQVCQVVWEFEGVTYQIDIPVAVGDSFTSAPAASSSSNTSVSTQEPSSSTASGQWGACGSCSACGANSNVCRTSPEGACIADPAGCDAPPMSPATTEEP